MTQTRHVNLTDFNKSDFLIDSTASILAVKYSSIITQKPGIWEITAKVGNQAEIRRLADREDIATAFETVENYLQENHPTSEVENL